jgi:ABC-type transport system involved in cytochrome c biogenesis permease subunit
LVPIIFSILVDVKFNPCINQVPVIALAYSVHALYVFLSTRGFQDGNFLPLTISYVLACLTKISVYLFFSNAGEFTPGISLLASYLAFVICCYLFYERPGGSRLNYQVHVLQFLIFLLLVFGGQAKGSPSMDLSSTVYLLLWCLAIPILISLPLGLVFKKAVSS